MTLCNYGVDIILEINQKLIDLLTINLIITKKFYLVT